MDISFVAPFDRAWSRMRGFLFRPFDLTRWLVVGFAAWISGLGDGRKGGGPIDILLSGDGDDGGATLGRLFDHPVWIPFFVFLGVLGLAVAVALLWVGARGKFIFLDNLATGQARVSEPWRRYARQGNSLFLWQLVFYLACAILAVAVFTPVFLALGIKVTGLFQNWVPAGVALLIVPIFLLIMIPVAYTTLFLEDFIVPIMYARKLTATQAWGEFLPLLRRDLLVFILYGLLVLVVTTGVALAAVGIGFATCCLGFLILSIPYVSTVLLLPLLVTYRAYSVCFLAQMDPRYDVLANAATPPVERPA